MEMDLPDPQWRALSPEEAGTGDDHPDDGVWAFQLRRTWVCNHCSNYVSPMSLQPFQWVWTKEEAVQHVQTVYVAIFPPTASGWLRLNG
jgi:hypothetical protein